MSDPFGDLSGENAEQIRKYLKFFRQKKEATLRSMNAEFSDAIHDRLNDDMFSKEDVIDFVDFLKGSVRSHISQDLSVSINMGALAVSQLLNNAQAQGVDLVLETASIENAALLDKIERMSLDAPTGRTPVKPLGKLTSLKDDAKALKDESERLENSNKELQERVSMQQQRTSQAQNETTKLMYEKKELLEQLSRLQVKLDASQSSSSSDAKETAEMNRKLDDMASQLDIATEENAKRVGETAQFQQMRKLMQAQATKLKDLRKRLQKYEPEDDGDYKD